MNETQLENIVSELILRVKIMENMPRMSDDDEINDVLLNIQIDEVVREEQEMFDYLNR